MKKISFLSMFTALAIMLGVTSCTKGDDFNDKLVSGNPTFMELKVSFRIPVTYATVDNNATTDESTVKSVLVFIFDKATGALVTKSDPLTPGDFSQSADGQKDVYTATKKIATTTGAKVIYVAVNFPDELLNDVALGMTINALKMTAKTTSAATLTNATVNGAGFAMFSTEDVEATLVETTNTLYVTNNSVTVPVERLSAKVAVQAGNNLSLSVGGGVLSNLQFAIKQSNKKTYRFKYIDNGVVKDPNWDTYSMVDFEDLSTLTGHEYVAVNAASISENKTLAARYTLENTHKLHLQKEVTYASIKATFVPDEFFDGTGAGKGSNVGKPARSFWMVMTNDGVKNYFDVENEADSYMLIAEVAAKAPVKSAEYINGICYYNLFLNPNGSYNVVRNAFYKATITQIIAPGNPASDPKAPEEPVETSTDMMVKFEILPWNLVEWDQILKP